jgi:hypothetical protein
MYLAFDAFLHGWRSPGRDLLLGVVPADSDNQVKAPAAQLLQFDSAAGRAGADG